MVNGLVVPTDTIAKRDAKFVAELLYPRLTDNVNKELTTYWHISDSHKVLKSLFKKNLNLDNPDEGYNYHSYEFNRLKYLLVGFLEAKLPNETYTKTNEFGVTYSGLRVKKENFNFTQDDLENWLVDLFFIPELEDF